MSTPLICRPRRRPQGSLRRRPPGWPRRKISRRTVVSVTPGNSIATSFTAGRGCNISCWEARANGSGGSWTIWRRGTRAPQGRPDMDLDYSPEERAYRERVIEFLGSIATRRGPGEFEGYRRDQSKPGALELAKRHQ